MFNVLKQLPLPISKVTRQKTLHNPAANLDLWEQNVKLVKLLSIRNNQVLQEKYLLLKRVEIIVVQEDSLEISKALLTFITV